MQNVLLKDSVTNVFMEYSKDRTSQMPNWKQWLPVYGVYKALRDNAAGRPSIIDEDHMIRYAAGIFYHSVVLSGILTAPIIISNVSR